MNQVLTLRFATVFAVSIGILFYVNPLNIDSLAWRSALAGIVAGLVGGLLAPARGRDVFVTTFCTTLTATVYANTYFGNALGISSIFLRLLAAIGLGSLAGYVGDALAQRFHMSEKTPLLGVIALTIVSGNARAAPPNLDAAWAAGYAAAVARACPNWHTDAAAIDRAGGAPDLQHGNDWAPEKPAAQNFALGARAAQIARLNRDFCDQPMPATPPENLVSAFLLRGALPD